MNKQFLFKSALATLLLTIILLAGCKKDDTDPIPTPTPVYADTVAPIITLTGGNSLRLQQFSTTTFNDPGATAQDAHDGNVIVTMTGMVNMYLADNYTITYTASDSAGNTATTTRGVTVDGALFLEGSYSVSDYTGGVLNGQYPEVINSLTLPVNQINFSSFGDYDNADVHATVSGTTITVPTQTVLCGTPAMNHTFSGSGTYTSGTAFTINYTDISTSGTYTCHGDYVKN